jgi:hypothetical protein
MMWDWSYFSSYSFVSGTKFKAAFENYFHCRPLPKTIIFLKGDVMKL